ncbi:phytanoyl-CoA dioxygenase family protein [Paraburkholderia sp. RL18-103-BIB-C]|uniref:phytanoyl-CoA dioxygenase family protein n=1 Tax=unclassified Paraburkholderia TaxID=2615204 RepID=UPI0038BC39F3
MRRVFKSIEHNDTFLNDGVVLAQLLTEDEARELQNFYWEDAPSSGLGFHATMFSRDAEYRARVDSKIKEYLGPRLALFLDNYRCVVGNYVVKEHSRPGTEVSVHQDWTFVDERMMRSVNVWCSLVDTDSSNGGQSIFKGSHRIVDVLRGPYFPSPFVTHAATIVEKYLMEVPLRAGQAIIYDHALVHATPPNRSQQTRVAANMVLIPREAQLLHCYLDQGDPRARPELFAIDDEFFLHNKIGDRPANGRSLGFVDHAIPGITLDQLPPVPA